MARQFRRRLMSRVRDSPVSTWIDSRRFTILYETIQCSRLARSRISGAAPAFPERVKSVSTATTTAWVQSVNSATSEVPSVVSRICHVRTLSIAPVNPLRLDFTIPPSAHLFPSPYVYQTRQPSPKLFPSDDHDEVFSWFLPGATNIKHAENHAY